MTTQKTTTRATKKTAVAKTTTTATKAVAKKATATAAVPAAGKDIASETKANASTGFVSRRVWPD